MIGKPASVAQPGGFYRFERLTRVSDAVHTSRQIELPGSPDQKFDEFGAAFIIAPVADPDDVALLFNFRHRTVQFDVGGLVPCKCAPRPSALDVELTQHLAKREHAVVSIEINSSEFM